MGILFEIFELVLKRLVKARKRVSGGLQFIFLLHVLIGIIKKR